MHRISSFDFLKIVGIMGVIILHTQPFVETSEYLNLLSILAADFAVPFFFIVSGYLFTKKMRASDDRCADYLRYMKRLFIAFFALSLIYMLVPVAPRGLVDLIQENGFWHSYYLGSIVARTEIITANPINLLFSGTSGHLWFIPSLMIGLSAVYLSLQTRLNGKILYAALPLYLVPSLVGPMLTTPIGALESQAGPFISVLFASIGMILALRDWRPSMWLAVIVLALGFTTEVFESLILVNYFDLLPGSYLAGVVLLGIGAMLLAMARPEMGKGSFISSLGIYTLGIYALHILARNTITELYPWFPYLTHGIALTIATFALSLLLTVLLARTPYVRKIVMVSHEKSQLIPRELKQPEPV